MSSHLNGFLHFLQHLDRPIMLLSKRSLCAIGLHSTLADKMGIIVKNTLPWAMFPETS